MRAADLVGITALVTLEGGVATYVSAMDGPLDMALSSIDFRVDVTVTFGAKLRGCCDCARARFGGAVTGVPGLDTTIVEAWLSGCDTGLPRGEMTIVSDGSGDCLAWAATGLSMVTVLAADDTTLTGCTCLFCGERDGRDRFVAGDLITVVALWAAGLLTGAGNGLAL